MPSYHSAVTGPVGSGTRAIVHLDLDAFYAAVEMLENPDLKGKPILIGGQPEERGVVAAASYPARAFGVRSAMPMSKALQRCPQAIVLPPRFDVYRQYSRQVMDILHQTSPLVEQISIDEAYLDLTKHVAIWEDAVDVARTLRDRVGQEVGLSASLGVATNKLVAKVASDRDKPGGLTVVRPGEEVAFLAPLPVRVLWGVGPRTAEKLAKMGVTTVGELAQRSEGELCKRFGQHGAAMANHARGIDRRPVVTEHERKSVSQERTFARDLRDAEALDRQLRHLSQRVAQHLARAEVVAGTVAIKLRYSDFETLTRQMTLAVPTDDKEAIYQVARALFDRTWQHGRPVRLLGVAGRHLCPPPGQLPLFQKEHNDSS
jgi:DNA polymerase-4